MSKRAVGALDILQSATNQSASMAASIHYFTLNYSAAILNHYDTKLEFLSDNYTCFICSFLGKVSAIICKGLGLYTKVKSNSFRYCNHLAYLLLKCI